MWMHSSLRFADLEHVPPHLRQEFKIMRDLDQKVQDIMRETQQRTTNVIQNAGKMAKEERMKEVAQIQNLLKKGKEISNDKVSRAENAYELIDKQIRRLDADMFEFKKALACEMTTPRKSRGIGVRAPFKSPLRPNSGNIIQSPVPSVIPTKGTDKKDAKNVRLEPLTPQATREEIDELTKKLMQNRTEPLDVDEELAIWRNRMHEYNEAKDACLQIFGLLAHAKGCLVRELYSQYGLELND
ncbi:Inhibitor of growth protein [Fasciolopsis buskii]|uniref:Inhibitor of growth protein n=1 Tax=Fasciolopsis buskii TaxID=27845 RepID=A0A8E0RRS7_9TREM|nr:Inhibitor of growth protein [Fasciolopsis buski]